MRLVVHRPFLKLVTFNQRPADKNKDGLPNESASLFLDLDKLFLSRLALRDRTGRANIGAATAADASVRIDVIDITF